MRRNLGHGLRGAGIVMAAAVWLFLSAGVAGAELEDIGFRYGHGFDGNEFDQFDLFLTMDLPWQKTFAGGWMLRSDIEGILGVLTWDGDTAVKPSVMPNLVLTTPGKKVDFIAGLGLGVMIGDTEFDDDEHDLGGPFFFQGQAGFRLHLSERYFLGYRYYHQSNAGIYDSNASVNLNQIELGYRF